MHGQQNIKKFLLMVVFMILIDILKLFFIADTATLGTYNE